MKYSRLLFFVLLIFLSGEVVYSQKIFREGFIVKKDREVLHGLVEYSSNQKVPAKCTFKRFDIAREVTYTPDQLLSFGYKDGNKYDSKELRNKVLFYEVIVSGKITLYKKGSDFFIEKDHNGIVQLVNGSITYSDNKGKTSLKSLPEFLNFLTEGLSGTIPERFNLKSDIVPLISSYDKSAGADFFVFNRSMTEKQIVQKAFETGVDRNRFGLLWGVNTYKLNPSSATDNSVFVPSPKQTSAIVFGLTFERLISRKSDRLSLKLDLLYNRHSFYYYEQETKNSVYIYRNDAFINFNGIKAPILFQYSFTGIKIIPYFNAGIAYQLMIGKDYKLITEVENTLYHEIKTYEYRNMDFHSGEISAVAGIGVRARVLNNINLNLQGRFEAGPGAFYQSTENAGYHQKPVKYNAMQATLLLGITF